MTMSCFNASIVHFYLYTAFYFVHFHIADNFEYDALNRQRAFLYPKCVCLQQQQQQAEMKGNWQECNATNHKHFIAFCIHIYGL